MARIGMDGKSGGNVKGGYITNPFKTIQDRNIMVTMKWGLIVDKGVDPHRWVYFSAMLRKGNDTEILDFGDAKNRVRTVGAPIASAFPPGVGGSKPIIFGQRNR